MGETEDSYAGSALYGRRDDLLRLLDEWKVYPDRVLDIGCGTGLLGEQLLWRGAREVWGVEPQRGAFEVASRRLSRVVNSAFPSKDLAGEHFDLVVLADVLEHMVDPWGVLAQVPALFTNVGEVLISVPNVSHLSIVAELLRGRWTYAEQGLLDRNHLRFFTPRTTVGLIDGAGLHIVRCHAKQGGRRRHRWPAALLRPAFPHLATFQLVTLSRAAAFPPGEPRTTPRVSRFPRG